MFNGLGGPTRPAVAESSVVEPIEEEEEIDLEYADEDDDGLEIDLHESQTKLAEQSAALQVQQAHLQQQEVAMLAMQTMMATMSAQIALIASPVPAVPPRAPSAIVAQTPPMPTHTRLTFPGYGVPSVLSVTRTSNLTTTSTASPPTPVSYRQSDVARFKVVGSWHPTRKCRRHQILDVELQQRRRHLRPEGDRLWEYKRFDFSDHRPEDLGGQVG